MKMNTTDKKLKIGSLVMSIFGSFLRGLPS